MNDEFNTTLWKMASTSPDLQEALKRNFRTAGYSIPTRTYCEATGEVEDIHFSVADIEDDTQRAKFMDAIAEVDRLTVGDLAKMLGYVRVALLVKEAEGTELTAVEETLRDIDISLFALMVTKVAPKVVGTPKPIKDIKSHIEEKLS